MEKINLASCSVVNFLTRQSRSGNQDGLAECPTQVVHEKFSYLREWGGKPSSPDLKPNSNFKFKLSLIFLEEWQGGETSWPDLKSKLSMTSFHFPVGGGCNPSFRKYDNRSISFP